MPQPLSTPTVPRQLSRRTAAWGSHTGHSYAPYQARAAALLDRPAVAPAPVAASAPVDRPHRPQWTVGRIAVLALVLAAAVVGFPAFQQWNAQLVLGDRLAGLVRVADGDGAAGALGNRLHAETGANGVRTAAYTAPDAPGAPILVAAGKRLTLRPEALVEAATPGPVGHQARTDGGFIRCVPMTDDGPYGTACAWADHGTVGYAVLRGRAVPAAAALVGSISAAATVR